MWGTEPQRDTGLEQGHGWSLGQSWEQSPAYSQHCEVVSLPCYLPIYFPLFLGSGHQQELLGMYCLSGMNFTCICFVMGQASETHNISQKQKSFTDPQSLLSK